MKTPSRKTFTKPEQHRNKSTKRKMIKERERDDRDSIRESSAEYQFTKKFHSLNLS